MNTKTIKCNFAHSYLGTGYNVDMSIPCPLSFDVNPIQEECGDPVFRGVDMFYFISLFVVLNDTGGMPPISTLNGQSFMIYGRIVNPG